jgi:hypothetical protein
LANWEAPLTRVGGAFDSMIGKVSDRSRKSIVGQGL